MVKLQVNGQVHEVDVDGATPLLYVLRDQLQLNGAKFGCGLGQCGACTVIVDRDAVFSCITPVSAVEGVRCGRSRASARSSGPDRCSARSSKCRRRNAAIASPA